MKYLFGALIASIIMTGIYLKFPNTFEKIVTVSVVKESEDCKEQGGIFSAGTQFSNDYLEKHPMMNFTTDRPDQLHIECDIPEKTISSQDIDL